MNLIKLKEPKEMDNSELLENTLQLYARACNINCSRELHERAMALKAELSNRLGGISGGKDGGIKTKVKLEIYETDNHNSVYLNNMRIGGIKVQSYSKLIFEKEFEKQIIINALAIREEVR